MMLVKGIRCGCEDGGFACGPVGGATVVEVAVVNGEGKLFFVLGADPGECVDFRISETPLYDLNMLVMDRDVDFDIELEKMNKCTIESWGFCHGYGDVIEVEGDSTFANVYKFAFMVLKEAVLSDSLSAEASQAFIKEYMGKDLDELELPEIMDCYEDEDDEEEE